MFSLTASQRRVFEILLVLILILDISAQVFFMQGPLFTIPQVTKWAPCIATLLGLGTFFWKPGRRAFIALLACLHYAVTSTSMHLYATSEADSWLWLMSIAFVLIPDKGEITESYWVGILKLVGFLVYFFAGLNKAIHWEWWNGETLLTVINDPSVTKGPFRIFADMPTVCMILDWFTLFQRLVVPWGLFSSKVLVRRICAGILALMHVSYMFILDVGTFSWVGILYLSLFFFYHASAEKKYFQLPEKTKRADLVFASLFASFLILIPVLAFAGKFGLQTAAIENLLTPRGFGMRWNMFADSYVKTPVVSYSVKTCSGKVINNDKVFWNFGANTSYFRRRFVVRMIDYELLQEASKGYDGTPGPLEDRLIKNFHEKVAGRRAKIASYSFKGSPRNDLKLEYDSGPRYLSDCSAQVASSR